MINLTKITKIARSSEKEQVKELSFAQVDLASSKSRKPNQAYSRDSSCSFEVKVSLKRHL